MIQPIKEEDMPEIISFLKDFFPVHNQFQKSDEEIADYLRELSAKEELIISDQGVMFLVKTGESSDKSHKIWKYRHFAFKSEGAASALLKEAEDRVKESSKTGKVELTLAEDEKSISFFKEQGYEEEGKLSNHYRWGETCLILSKSFE